MKHVILFSLLFCTIPSLATTWYVRPDGGTRYSEMQTGGQCNGRYNAAYPGIGVNQNCAFGDIRYLWTDGTRTTNASAGSPAWGWIGSGGDTYVIDCPNDCRIGPNSPNNLDYFGLAGNPYGAGAPPPLNGTATAHTRIRGVNFANCTSDSAKAHINGGYGVNAVFNLKGVSYVDFACFNITDHSNCGRAAQTHGCSTNYPLSDFAGTGIVTNNATTNTSITDVLVHGMALNGMVGATGTGVSLLRVGLVGNASSGWNMDDGSGTTGTGILNVDGLSVLWNGCAEEYPIVDALPYQDCTDGNTGGHGDGIGTATVTSNPAWQITFTNSVAAFNTRDGFDLAHLQGAGSSLTISQSLAYSNMGQQLYVGSASTVRNNLLIGNCNALRRAIPGTPTGYNTRLKNFCYASDVAAFIKVQDSTPTYFQFNTVYSANATGLEIDCNGICTPKSTMVYEDNVFIGFLNNAVDGYPSGGTGNYPGLVYLTVPGLFSNPGSLFNDNVTFHPTSNWTCPATKFDETDAFCGDPQLTDETWHLYGFGNMGPELDSRVVGLGTLVPGVTVDFNGATRPNLPTIGALEYGSKSPGDQIAVNVTPNPVGLGQSVTLTATVSQTGSEVPTGSVNFLNGSVSLGKAILNSSGVASIILAALPVGSYGVVGVYSGDLSYPPCQSGVALLQVLPAATTTLAASPNPVITGQALTLTATVKGSGTVVPAGVVTFLNGSAALGTATLNASGVASLSTASLSAGTYSLTATYSGNTSFPASTSAGVLVTVQGQTTTTTLTASPNPVIAGQALTLTATVKGSGTGVPAGTVSFLNGSTVLGTATLNASGTASLSTASVSAGTYSLTATYSGNTSFPTSTSAAVLVTVQGQTTATTLAASPNPVIAGQALTLTVAVKGSGTGVSAGTVTFLNGSTALGTATLNASGVASLSTVSLSAGTYGLTAQYAGSGSFLASASVSTIVTVAAVDPASGSSVPVILYTDITSGPNSGGEGNNGTYLTIFGTHFGPTQGSSKVTISGKAVAQYLLWSDTKIGVQVGPVSTGPIVVSVGSVSSNANQTFTVRSGHIYYIGSAVDNSAPPSSCSTLLGANSYATPSGLTNYASKTEANYSYTKMRTPYTYYRCLSLGDTLVFLDGVTYPYFDGQQWHSSLTPDKTGATASSFMTFMARPGAKVQLGGTGWAMAPIRDITNGYNVYSGLTLTGSGANGGVYFNAGGSVRNNRVVGNEVTCPDCWGPAGAVMAGDGFIMYGNTVHNVSTLLPGGSNKTYHAVYVAGNNIEIAWNRIYNTLAYNGIQINHDGTSGFYNQSWHDNDIADVNGSGINLSTIDPSLGYIRVFNNVIHHVGLAMASDSAGPHSCLAIKGYGSAVAPGTVDIYNNTMVDCSSYLNTNPADNTSCAVLDLASQLNVTMNLVNNIVYQPAYAGTAKQNVYICGGGSIGTLSGSNNLWYSDSPPGSTATATSYGKIANPLFISNTNYEVQSGSPAIGAGIAFDGLTTDLNAAPRPNPPAIGAYQ